MGRWAGGQAALENECCHDFFAYEGFVTILYETVYKFFSHALEIRIVIVTCCWFGKKDRTPSYTCLVCLIFFFYKRGLLIASRTL